MTIITSIGIGILSSSLLLGVPNVLLFRLDWVSRITDVKVISVDVNNLDIIQPVVVIVSVAITVVVGILPALRPLLLYELLHARLDLFHDLLRLERLLGACKHPVEHVLADVGVPAADGAPDTRHLVLKGLPEVLPVLDAAGLLAGELVLLDKRVVVVLELANDVFRLGVLLFFDFPLKERVLANKWGPDDGVIITRTYFL